MTQTFIISDLHWGHKGILKHRPHFSSIEEHDNLILDNILKTTNKRDSLWLLGDCFFDEASIGFLRIIKKHCAYVNWVIGNHDTDTTKRQKLLRKILAEGLIHKVGSMFKQGGFWFTHHPMHPLELRGRFNIHGHVHNDTIPDNRYFNVCCENVDYTPIRLQNLIESIHC